MTDDRIVSLTTSTSDGDAIIYFDPPLSEEEYCSQWAQTGPAGVIQISASGIWRIDVDGAQDE
jgi:hypothetical protein